MAIDFSTIKILENFQDYLLGINGEVFEQFNANTSYVRRIHIPFPNTSIKMVLSQADLKELRVLVSTFVNDYKSAEEDSRMIKKLAYISDGQLN